MGRAHTAMLTTSGPGDTRERGHWRDAFDRFQRDSELSLLRSPWETVNRAVRWRVLVFACVFSALGGIPEDAVRAAGQGGAVVSAPAETVRALKAALADAVQRFEAQDVAGVLAHVSDRYRTGPFTKPGIREQLIAMYSIHDAVRARVRIDEVQMVGEHAWVYSTGEVSGRLRFVGAWVVLLSWQRELEVARREAGAWRLFGYQQ